MYLVFIAVVAIIVVALLYDMMDPQAMPFRCPRCGFGGDDDIAGEPRHWYRLVGGGKAKCQTCHTVFKEHPNGALVEDR